MTQDDRIKSVFQVLLETNEVTREELTEGKYKTRDSEMLWCAVKLLKRYCRLDFFEIGNLLKIEVGIIIKISDRKNAPLRWKNNYTEIKSKYEDIINEVIF